jgi:hypothetical protein
MKDVRYLTLRAFACYANLVLNKAAVCPTTDMAKLFNDNGFTAEDDVSSFLD